MLRTKSREQKQKRKAAAWGSLELRDALTLEGEALEPLSRLGSRQRKRHFGEAIDGVAEGITKLLNPPVQEIDHLPKLDLEHLLEDTKVSIKELEKGLSEAAGAIDNSEGTPQGVGGVLVNFVPNPLRAQLDQKRKLSSAIRLKLKKLAADKPPKPAPTRAEKEIRRQYAKIQDIAELRKANEDLCQQFPELEELIKRLFYEKEIEILERS